MSLLNIPKQNLHHTNICIGPREQIKKEIEAYIQTLSSEISNIESLIYEYNTLKVEDVEKIISVHLRKTSDDSMQIISLFLNAITPQAQNNMLKMLEEPKSNTYFFIQTNSLSNILPTVISRAHVHTFSFEKTISKETEEFLQSSLSKRLEFVKQLTEQIKKEKKTKQDAINLLEEIELFCHQNKKIPALKKIIEIKDYLKDSGASTKQLLEYVSLVV